MSRRTGIIIAMQKEWDAFFADTQYCGCAFAMSKTRKGVPYTALISGIGKVNAAVAAYKLWKEYDCNHILSFGCAGGLDFTIHVGDVVVGDEYMYWDVNCGSPNVLGQVQGHPATYQSDYKDWRFLEGMKHGLIATGDGFVDNEFLAETVCQSLHPDHYPIAIDMESAAIAQVCERRHVGFTSVRVISDNPLSGERTYDAFWEQKDKALSELFKKFTDEN